MDELIQVTHVTGTQSVFSQIQSPRSDYGMGKGSALRRLFNGKVIVSLLILSDMVAVILGILIADSMGASPAAISGSGAILSLLFFIVLTVEVFYHLAFYRLKTIVHWFALGKIYLLVVVSVNLPLFILNYWNSGTMNSPYYWLLSVALISYSLIWIFRFLISLMVRIGLRRRLLGENVAIIGDPEVADNVLSDADSIVDGWWNIVGLFSDQSKDDNHLWGKSGVGGDVAEIVRLARAGQIQHVVIAIAWKEQERVQSLCEVLSVLPVMVSLAYDPGLFTGKPKAFPGMPEGAPLLDINHLPSFGWAGIVKLVEDKVLSLLLLIAFGPLFLLISLLIKIDSRGPVLFRQARYGFNKKEIVVYKFRTMYYDRSAEKHFRQATRNDKRVTRVGRILRKTSLDELPQILNVIRGDMSLVGPRPHPMDLDDSFADRIAGIDERHNVKPGITGWAQINGHRGETDTLEKMASRVKYDLFYIQHWNLLLDLKILARTAISGWVHKNAY